MTGDIEALKPTHANMNRKHLALRSILLSLSIAALTGCASTASEPAKYDPTASRAWNITKAGGIDRLKDQSVSAEEYKQITSSNIALDAGWIHSSYVNPAPGFSSGAALGITLAAALFTPNHVSTENSLIAWMPSNLAEDKQQAKELFRQLVGDAMEKGLHDLGLGKEKPQTGEMLGTYAVVTSIVNNELGCRPYAKGEKNTCSVSAFFKAPLAATSPSFITGQPYQAYAFTVVSNINRSHLKVNSGPETTLDEAAVYAAVSKHLPEWAFLYLGPKKVRNADRKTIPYPFVQDQGKLELFIKPQTD